MKKTIERKKAEGQIRAALDYTNSIVATLREPFLVLDKNLRIISTNRSFCRTFKVTEEETDGQLLPDLDNEQWNISKLLRLLKEILPKETVIENYEVEHDFERIGHRIMNLNARQLRIPKELARVIAEEKEEELILLAIEDITEQKEKEREVEEARDYANSVIRTIREPLLVLSGDLKIVSASRFFYQTFKVAPKETEGKFIYDLGNHQWDIPKLRQLLEEILPKKTAFDELEVEHDFPRIGKRVMLLNARRIPPPPEQPERILLAFEDITEKKRREKAMIEALSLKRELEQQKEIDRMKTEFLSVASHQLRAPLGSMRWNMEMLLGGDFGEVPKTAKEIVQQIYESNQRMIALINDLLDVSRIEQGRVQDEPKLSDIVVIVQAAIEEMEPEAQKRSVMMELEVKEDSLPKIMIDPKRFREVIQNLLSNAVKYNARPGKVNVSVKRLDGKIQISVANNGPAIPEEDQSKIFSKFFRGSAAIKSEAEGSGLGLFVVKSYVEGWGGTVAFESQEGKGTTFTIILPLKPKQHTLDNNFATQPHQIKEVKE